MNNYGLYVLDDTKRLAMQGFAGSDRVPAWYRAKIKYNGSYVGRSLNEKNRYGLYVKGDKLVLNGEELVQGDGAGLSFTEDEISFGNIPLRTFSKAINITKEDYINLRSGLDVEGYAPYNPKTPYNIVEDVETADTEYYSSEFEQEDIIYNSYNNSLSENTLTNNTFLSVNPPTLAIRPFESIIDKGEGLVLRYFVDTKYYDSVHIKKKGSETSPRIHLNDTFTVIVKDSIGRILYKATTYAGEFKVRLKPFKVIPDNTDYDDDNIYDATAEDFIGETTFSVQCIDSEHRGSVERFFHVLIEDKTEQKELYQMTPKDAEAFFIDSGRHDNIAGYKNKIAFTNLFKKVMLTPTSKGGYAGQYSGIKLYNPDKPDKGFGGYTYYIDNHPNVALLPEVEEGEEPQEVEPVLGGVEGYYLIYFDATENKVFGVGTDGLYEIDEAIIANFNENPNGARGNTGCKIIPNKSFLVNNKRCNVGSSSIDWILDDGAELYSDMVETDHGTIRKIRVSWGVESDNNKEVYTNSGTTLRTYRLNDILKNATFRQGNIEYYQRMWDGQYAANPVSHFKVTGYYYCIYVTPVIADYSSNEILSPYQVRLLPNRKDNFIQFPDNFTLDLNGATIRMTDCTDLHGAAAMFLLVGNTNTHIKNGRIQGAYDSDSNYFTNLDTDEIRKDRDKTLKIGCLRQALTPKHMNGVSDGTPNIHFKGSKFCTLDNIENIGSTGFETSFGWGMKDKGSEVSTKVLVNYPPRQTDESYKEYNDLLFSNLGFIALDGTLHTLDNETDSTDEVDENGTPYASGVGEVKLAINDDYIPLDDDTLLRYKMTYPVEKDFGVKKFYIQAGASDQCRSGAYPELFVYCYQRDTTDPNNVTYTLIKIIKTAYWTYVVVPNNTTDIRLVGYSWYTNNTITLLNRLGINATTPCINCTGTNVHVHHTRSIALNGMGINIRFINCRFNNIQDVLDNLFETKMLMDIEENHKIGYIVALIDCVCNQFANISGRTFPQSVVQAAARGCYFENCIGVGYAGQLQDGYIKNCAISKLDIGHLARLASNHQGIVKGITVNEVRAAYNKLTFNISHINPGDSVTTNVSVEDVTKDIAIDDLFVVITAPKHMTLELCPGNMRIAKGTGQFEGASTNLYPAYTNVVYNKKAMVQEQTIE